MLARKLLFTPPPGMVEPVRSEGAHVSAIIKSIMQQLEPKRFARPAKPEDEELQQVFFEFGFTWEKALELSLGRRWGQPRPWVTLQQELLLDGVYGTLDGDNTRRRCLEEYKLTYMSSNAHISDRRFWHWHVQIKAYLWMLLHHRENYKAECRLFACHLRGDYRGTRLKVVPWRLRYDVAELRDNWRMLMREKRRMERAACSRRRKSGSR